MIIFKQPYIWIIPGILFFFGVYTFCCGYHHEFGYFASKYFGSYCSNVNTTAAFVVAMLAFVLFGAVFWLNAGALMNKRIHTCSYILIFFLTALFTVCAAIGLEADHSPTMMIFLPGAVTAAVLNLWATTVVRLRGAALREMERLEESYKIANEEKLKAERFKTELIANVSHDIRTPLTSIINYVDFIDGLGIEDERLREYVGILKKTSNRLKTLIGDLLDASKAGTGSVVMNVQIIDLAELLGQIVGDFDAAFAERNLTYVNKHNGDKIPVAADGKYLYRVLENLFGNVAKYALPGTRVYVEIGGGGAMAWLSVKNVSAQQLDVSPEMLTERFVQGERSRNTEGNGLGLYIAKYLLEGMEGQLAVNISGDLFEVRITLPVYNALNAAEF
jgi:signal transduction histidine kinase